MSTPRPFLYVKTGCPWCTEAEEYLKQHGIAYGKADVHDDPAALEEMKRLSGQTKAPTMRWDDEILADFGADELDVFLRKEKRGQIDQDALAINRNVKPFGISPRLD